VLIGEFFSNLTAAGFNLRFGQLESRLLAYFGAERPDLKYAVAWLAEVYVGNRAILNSAYL
jgi:hypothetical protein